jgi:hypothetical protein
LSIGDDRIEERLRRAAPNQFVGLTIFPDECVRAGGQSVFAAIRARL